MRRLSSCPRKCDSSMATSHRRTKVFIVDLPFGIHSSCARVKMLLFRWNGMKRTNVMLSFLKCTECKWVSVWVWRKGILGLGEKRIWVVYRDNKWSPAEVEIEWRKIDYVLGSKSPGGGGHTNSTSTKCKFQ